MQSSSLHPPPAAATPRGRKGRPRRDRTWHITVFNYMPLPWDQRDWAELPQDAISCIFRKMNQFELLLGAAAVCRSWRRAAWHEPELWRCIDMRYLLEDVPPSGWQATRSSLVRAALRLSAGQCETFVAELLDDDLFIFLSEQAPLLKNLYLIKCYYVSKEVFAKVMYKFPLLEELELLMWLGGTEMLEIVAEACPCLKHFSLIKQDRFYELEDDGNAFAIAKMHGLRSLYLDGNRLTNKGLTVILDGCPHLEHLNVFECIFASAPLPLPRRAPLRPLRPPASVPAHPGRGATKSAGHAPAVPCWIPLFDPLPEQRQVGAGSPCDRSRSVWIQRSDASAGLSIASSGTNGPPRLPGAYPAARECPQNPRNRRGADGATRGPVRERLRFPAPPPQAARPVDMDRQALLTGPSRRPRSSHKVVVATPAMEHQEFLLRKHAVLLTAATPQHAANL
ncbi:putative F-box/LRR-repeat protein 21 [Triticum aestivum]|uniref:putative F-box/LRR-repeat protein 21 n=1 Tax=Triticum aestivum TaxID=4565 RepID=UPI001D02D906|nr:putative F-box/LRR-repeat protein 21 [Triticum aestivum]